jgi:hypothetical protein
MSEMMLFRSMIEAEDGRPLLVSTARGLGLRAGEIPLGEGGQVEPETGGMSVAHGSPDNLIEHRRPKEFGGTGKDPVWEISADELGEALAFRDDPELEGHGFVEPRYPMHLEEYTLALAETRDIWRKCV